MKKFEMLGKSLTKDQQRKIVGGDDCLVEYAIDCCLPGGETEEGDPPCCSGLKCEVNGTGSGTICMAV